MLSFDALADMIAGPTLCAPDVLALDKSARKVDQDGHFYVKGSVVSAAQVNPYKGSEIPDYERLGLRASGVYELYRDAKELEKGTASLQGKPLLMKHKPVSADDHPKSIVVGSVNNPRFENGKVIADLVVWDQDAIDSIEDGSQRDLSAGYRYVPVIEDGTAPDGSAYQGRMTDILFNHVALVGDGRVEGAMVADSAEAVSEWSQLELAFNELGFDAGTEAQWLKLADVVSFVLAMDAGKWDEGKHPRGEGGKFAKTNTSHVKAFEKHQASKKKAEERAKAKSIKTEAKAAKIEAKTIANVQKALKANPALAAKLRALLGEGFEAKTPSSPAVRSVGEPRKITTPDGKMEIEAKPELVELADLQHAKGDLQPRNRDTAESKTAIRERAANFDPEQMQPGRVSDTGAPMVAPDGTIISGNGRTMSLREVYENPNLKERADAYRKSLGDAAKGMKHPVLVMRLPKDMSHEQLAEFADRSNRSRIEGMGATERAKRDAKAAGLGVVSLYRGGDFTSAENRPFMHAFTQKAMSANERAQFSKEGRLTKEGQDRLNAAVLASAYDDVDALSMMLESTDDNVKSITNAMKDTAGRFAELKAGVAAGRIKADMDVTSQISDAAKLVSSLRKKGVSPASHFQQIDAFSRPDPMVEALVKSFYADNMTRGLSQQKITSILNAYSEEAMKHQPGGFLPDDTTAEEVLQAANKRTRKETGEQDLFGGNAGHEQSNGAGREGNGRQGAEKAGRRTESQGARLAA